MWRHDKTGPAESVYRICAGGDHRTAGDPTFFVQCAMCNLQRLRGVAHWEVRPEFETYKKHCWFAVAMGKVHVRFEIRAHRLFPCPPACTTYPWMNSTIQNIPLANLALAFIPVLAVIVIIWKWNLGYKNSLYAIFRMLLQLLLIGFFLAYIFDADSPLIVVAVLTVMLFSSSWIALRTMTISRKSLFLKSLGAIAPGGIFILFLTTAGVLRLEPWYSPSYVVPLAGMIFASAMNSVSLAGERLEAEMKRDLSFDEARVIALKASLIPITNSLFAVGLVSIPGMMTGQILSGVSPFIAARYQIMVMCMIFGSAGISAATFLALVRSDFSRR